MVSKLYKNDLSPPSRACMMVCDLFNVPAEIVDLNLMQLEHKTPEYQKKNPLQTVPVLEEDDFMLLDSHAIVTYLADKYAREDTYYPKDIKRRAFVNQKLFFNCSVLFPRIKDVAKTVILEGAKTVSDTQIATIEEAYGLLEGFLCRTKYLAGNNITIADVTAFATVSTMDVAAKIDSERFPKLTAWVADIGQQPYAQKNAGVLLYKSLMEKMLA